MIPAAAPNKDIGPWRLSTGSSEAEGRRGCSGQDWKPGKEGRKGNVRLWELESYESHMAWSSKDQYWGWM